MNGEKLEFSSLSDAVHLMQRITETLIENDPYYEDFKFFSAINCTTQSEFRQELKTFLDQVLSSNIMLVISTPQEDFTQDLERLYNWL